MCGLTGIIANNPEGLGIGLTEMLKEIEHRGRDATGFAVYEIRDDIQIPVCCRCSGMKPEFEYHPGFHTLQIRLHPVRDAQSL